MARTGLMRFSILLLCLAPLTCGTRESSVGELSEDDVAALRAATQEYRDAEAANDWEAVTLLYSENAIRMLPKGPTIQGREAILREFESRPSYMLDYDQRMDEAVGSGNLAFVTGVFSYVVDVKGDTLTGSGKYIAIYRKQSDGAWLIDRDIFNFDAPSSSQPPPPN